MNYVWTYNKKPIEEIVGEFYTTAGTFNGLVHVPAESIVDRLIGPNAWYIAKFKKDGIKSKIWEWRNLLALDDFLDSIEIKYNSERVYFANVYRDNASIHINQKVCKDTEWVRKIIQLTEMYS